MNRPQLAILDVGHGNAAVLFDTNGVVVVDSGKGGTLLDFLKQQKVSVVDVLFVSHSDDDHIADAPNLLLDGGIKVRRVFFNTDSSKTTDCWRAFLSAIRYSRQRQGTHPEPQLTTALNEREINHGQICIEVLYPPPEIAGAGPGSKKLTSNKRLDSNSMCAVIRLKKGKEPMVLLSGDVEQACLDFWKAEPIEPSAAILVFPHHGGLPRNGNPERFAAELAKAVEPKFVIFSIGRGEHGKNPRVEIVDSIRKTLPGAKIICTQLSEHCATVLPSGEPDHLLGLAARGKESRRCCAGSIMIDLSGGDPIVMPKAELHDSFIESSAPSALCRRAPPRKQL